MNADNRMNKALTAIPNIAAPAAGISLSRTAVSSWGCTPARLSGKAPAMCPVKLPHRMREVLNSPSGLRCLAIYFLQVGRLSASILASF